LCRKAAEPIVIDKPKQKEKKTPKEDDDEIVINPPIPMTKMDLEELEKMN